MWDAIVFVHVWMLLCAVWQSRWRRTKTLWSSVLLPVIYLMVKHSNRCPKTQLYISKSVARSSQWSNKGKSFLACCRNRWWCEWCSWATELICLWVSDSASNSHSLCWGLAVNATAQPVLIPHHSYTASQSPPKASQHCCSSPSIACRSVATGVQG